MWAGCQHSLQYRLGVIALLLYKLTSFLSHPLLTLSTQPLVPLSALSVSQCVRFSSPLTQGYLFFHWVEPQCQVKASIGRMKRVAGVRSQGPTLPSKPWSETPGWSFKQSAPSFIIHATALKIFFRNTISSPHIAPLLFLSSFFFFPPRQSIHKVWIKLMTSRAALWKSHCRKRPYIMGAEGARTKEGKKRKKNGQIERKRVCMCAGRVASPFYLGAGHMNSDTH